MIKPRLSFLWVVLTPLIALASCTPPDGGGEGGQETEAALVERARGIHERVITLDTHADISPNNFTPERNYTMDLPNQVTLPKMEAGGLDVAFFIVYVGQGDLTDEGYARAYQQAMDKFNAIHWLADEYATDRIELAYTSDDVRRIVASGKKVAMIGIENAYQVGLDLSNIQRFQELGGRYMSLAHNGHSQFSDSNTGERNDEWLHNGLSDLGRQAIAEMNRVGIMIDISHPSKEAIMQMFELTRAPVIASHSSARALNDHSRNLDEEQLMALRDNGGVVQTVAFRSYVDGEKNSAHQQAVNELRASVAEELGIELQGRGGRGGRGGGRGGRGGRGAAADMTDEERAAAEAFQAQMAELQATVESRMDEVNAVAPPVGVADFVDHIDYLVELIGLDHVGISSDFDGGGGVDGWNDASESFNVTLELVRRGYTEEQIGKLWSGNLLRVLDEVQRTAQEIQAEG